MSQFGHSVNNASQFTNISIPQTLEPEISARLMPCTNKLIQVLPTNASSQNAGGIFNLSIPNQGWVKNGTVFLRFRVNFAQAANTAKFSTGGASAASIINRLTITCGNVLEQISNYYQWYNLLMQHATSRNYFDYDASITDCANEAMAGATNYDVCIPLVCGMFYNTAGKHIPAFLFASPIQIQLDINTLPLMFNADTTAVTAVTISNMSLCYEQLMTDETFNMAIKQKMASGSVWSLPIQTVTSISTTQAGAGAISFNTGLNLSSLDSVIVTGTTTNLATTISTKYNNLDAADVITDVRVFCDGLKMCQYALDTRPIQFVELQRCLGNLYSVTDTSNVDRDTYLTDGWATGCSTRRLRDSYNTYEGVPCSQALIQIDGAAGANTCYFFFCWSGQINIDGAGQVMLSR